MTGLKRTLSHAAPAFAVVVVLTFAGRSDAASCGHYVTYKGMPAAHQMADHATDQGQSEPGDKRPCQGPNCSRAPMSVPPVAPTTTISLHREPLYCTLHQFVLDCGISAFSPTDELAITQFSPADIFRPPCCA